jgi:hypothetical protein
MAWLSSEIYTGHVSLVSSERIADAAWGENSAGSRELRSAADWDF